MGLDITAYSHLSPVVNRTDRCERVECYHAHLWDHSAFPGRAAPFKAGCYYDSGATLGFRAGSYSGYNDWRERLASLTGLSVQHFWEGGEGPFAELINFADNEGTIGTEAARRLLADFDRFESEAKEKLDDWDFRLYRYWHTAFRLAAEAGAVSFH